MSDWEAERKVISEKAKAIVDSIDLPPDNTYVWKIGPKGDTTGKGFYYGTSKQGLRSSLINSLNHHDVTVQVIPQADFKTVY